jgi:hypothetical protein
MKNTKFIGLDVHKLRISVAVAQAGEPVEYLGEIDNEPCDPEALRSSD